MKRSIQAFGSPLILSVALSINASQSYSPVPVQWTWKQMPDLPNSALPPTLRLYSTPPLQPRQMQPRQNGPGDAIPHTYSLFGLRTGPHGMTFTDENGKDLLQASPKVITGPFVALPDAAALPPLVAPKLPAK